ncbi:MAG TPA: TIGR00730 family Rossman fold protein [Phycisphaerae bacterium]|nr:TIGR00730 family Rossman fold protein [Phycisphaerae bacterium]HNU46059.1 TIGR00730 family Rossman fold protein [Phycisphaerae bacterium]
MKEVESPSDPRAAQRQARAEAIRGFLAQYAPSPHDDLLAQMLVNICRLAADGADRGDLKILNTALAELRYAFKVFQPYAEVPKVTIFGSARTPEEHPQYQAARRFAALMREHGWMVITGAGNGIMRAGHHGATREASFGVAISLPFEQETNTIIANDAKLINFRYFFTRKLIFVKEAEAIALFPGGFGTLDECFEALTLVQTGKDSPKPIVLCDEPGGTYWREWRRHVETVLLHAGMIDPTDMDLFHLTDRAEDAAEEVLRFYRCYHSSRFVDDLFVIRLQRPLAAATLAEVDDTFADIVGKGGFEQFLHPVEGEEGAFPERPRLTFYYNRRSAGRLRLLIDRINRDVS